LAPNIATNKKESRKNLQMTNIRKDFYHSQAKEMVGKYDLVLSGNDRWHT
jgi:hypothetical protein